MNVIPADDRDTATPHYTERLRRSTGPVAALKQLPYRAHIAALQLGDVLDLGCGIGRNLAHNGGRGVGIDHNPTSIAIARARGLAAFTPQEFAQSQHARRAFDAILCAHVAEHMERAAFVAFARPYLASLVPGGRFVLITPQRRGFASDPTHVEFIDFSGQRSICEDLGLHVARSYSFPFPLAAGNIFAYNEFVSIAHKR